MESCGQIHDKLYKSTKTCRRSSFFFDSLIKPPKFIKSFLKQALYRKHKSFVTKKGRLKLTVSVKRAIIMTIISNKWNYCTWNLFIIRISYFLQKVKYQYQRVVFESPKSFAPHYFYPWFWARQSIDSDSHHVLYSLARLTLASA